MEKKLVFHEIYDYYYQPFMQTFAGKLTLILAVAFVASLITYLVVRRKKQQQPAWIWALQQIELLDIKKCSNKKDFKQFYFSLTVIIKKYLSKRYHWKTADKTDEEFILYLKDQRFDPELLHALSKMLEGAVWIKFAGEDVIKTQAVKDLEQAKAVIKQTIPESHY